MHTSVIRWEINEAVAKNPPYDKALFVKNGVKISYEDKKYTSRLGVDVSVFQGDILTGSRWQQASQVRNFADRISWLW